MPREKNWLKGQTSQTLAKLKGARKSGLKAQQQNRDIKEREKKIKIPKAAIAMDVEATSVLYIPHEILHDILQKLPVKTLLRFKSVCKSWRALISSPEFIESHLNLNIKAHNVNPFYNIDDDTEGYVSLTSSINRYSEASQLKLVELKYPFRFQQQPRIVVKVLGSCNGLLLVGDFSEIFLWNPSTGDHKRVPNTGICTKKYHPDQIPCIYGLGYDSLLDEYKAVILIIEYASPLHSLRIYEIESHMFLFSSRTGDWKKVDVNFFPYSIYCSSYLNLSLGLTVNGFPHWVVGDQDDCTITSYQTIIYFDTVDDKFKKLPTPTWWRFQKSPVNSISVLEGCLCAAHDNVVDGCVDVLAMKEYGVKESWTKLFAIRCCSLWSFLPLGFINNGNEIVFQLSRMELLTCNLKTNVANFSLSTKKKLRASYVESLVSPL